MVSAEPPSIRHRLAAVHRKHIVVGSGLPLEPDSCKETEVTPSILPLCFFFHAIPNNVSLYALTVHRHHFSHSQPLPGS